MNCPYKGNGFTVNGRGVRYQQEIFEGWQIVGRAPGRGGVPDNLLVVSGSVP